MTTITNPKIKPKLLTDAAVQKAKVTLVREVGRLLLDDIANSTSGFKQYPLVTSGKSGIKDPTAIISIRYIGEWVFCPQRKRLHITGYHKRLIDSLVEKYTKRYPKFVIGWDSDERAWVHITIKNKQSPKLAMLNGSISPTQKKEGDYAAKDLELVKSVAAALEYKLRYSHPKSIGCHVPALDWQRVDGENAQAVVDISIKQYGEYEHQDEVGKFYGHSDYFMNETTFTFFKSVLDDFRKKHPEIAISWHEGDKDYVHITVSKQDLRATT